MIILKNKDYIVNEMFPYEDFTAGLAKYIVSDNSVLAEKVKQYYPYYDFVTDEAGDLIDIKPIDPPVLPAPEPEPEPVTTEDLALAVAELAEKQEQDKLQTDMALAELAELLTGGV